MVGPHALAWLAHTASIPLTRERRKRCSSRCLVGLSGLFGCEPGLNIYVVNQDLSIRHDVLNPASVFAEGPADVPPCSSRAALCVTLRPSSLTVSFRCLSGFTSDLRGDSSQLVLELPFAYLGLAELYPQIVSMKSATGGSISAECCMGVPPISSLVSSFGRASSPAPSNFLILRLLVSLAHLYMATCKRCMYPRESATGSHFSRSRTVEAY